MRKINVYGLFKYLLICLLIAPMIGMHTAEARILNKETEGSLTIHKVINPAITPPEKGGEGFEGDGSIETGIPSGGLNEGHGETKPLPGVEFSVYGRLTKEELATLVDSTLTYDPKDPMPLDSKKVKEFISGRKATYVGVTDDEGKVTFSNIPIHTENLADNLYLVVETKTPVTGADGKPIVQQGSMPVLVNIPSVNPLQDTEETEVNNYIYDVNLFMKNYHQLEPEIEKEIDKPTHSVGEEVKYNLVIKPLPFDMNEYLELEVTDDLDEALNFHELGAVTFHLGGSDKATVVFQEGTDFTVSAPTKGQNGTIHWVFKKAGLDKLTGIKAGDGSSIQLKFTAVTNEKVKPDQSIPNKSSLDFVNKWGYGTKPSEGGEGPEKPTAPIPSEVVNTIFGQRKFAKVDKDHKNLKLKDAEFILRNQSTLPTTAWDEKGQMSTYPAGTVLYGIFKGQQLVGWTNNFSAVAKDIAEKGLGKSSYTITSNNEGAFQLEGLAYTNEVHYKKQYIFAVMGTTTNGYGTEFEIVDHYEQVVAKARTSETTQAEIDAEIAEIVAQHPGEENGAGAWKFYKESEVDPALLNSSDAKAVIDFLGNQINSYELIEVRAPQGYLPLEKEPKEVAASSTDPYKNGFKFTVPALGTGGLPNYEGAELEIPNAKIPEKPVEPTNPEKPTGPETTPPGGLIPNLGEAASMIVVVIGLLIIVGAVIFKVKKL